MIKATNLSKHYITGGQKFTAVDRVDITVAAGEFLSVVGHSGSGKSTLLSMMGGLMNPTTGEVLIDGTDIWKLPDSGLSHFRNRKINFIFQFSSLIPTLNALDNVMLPSAFGRLQGDVREKAADLLAMVGLRDMWSRYPSELSGGQQRRVAIARSFINDPLVVLADEPTGDLDEESEKDVFALFRRMNKERGITFVLVTHSRELAGMTDRRVTMSHGVLSES